MSRAAPFLDALVVLLAAGAALGANPPAAGMIVSAAGDAVISRGDATVFAVEGTQLLPGDRVVVPLGGRCTGFGPNGIPFALDGPAQIAFEPPASGGALEDISAWVRRQLADWLGQTRRRSLTTRGTRDWPTEADVPRQLIPASGGAVRASVSQFVWVGAPGVDRYVVTIAPEVGEEVSHTVRGTTLQLEDLGPGSEYVWKVAPDRGSASSWRSFRVLTDDDAARLDEAVASVGDLDAGVLLLAAGLHGEALARLDAAVASGEGGPSALVWRSRVLAQIGLYEDAYYDLTAVLGAE